MARQQVAARESARARAALGDGMPGQYPLSLLEATADAILVTSPDLTVRWASPRARTAMSTHSGFVIGSPVTDLVHHDDVGIVMRMAETFCPVTPDPGQAPTAVIRWHLADGSFRRMWSRMALVSTSDHFNSQFVICLHEVDGLIASLPGRSELVSPQPPKISSPGMTLSVAHMLLTLPAAGNCLDSQRVSAALGLLLFSPVGCRMVAFADAFDPEEPQLMSCSFVDSTLDEAHHSPQPVDVREAIAGRAATMEDVDLTLIAHALTTRRNPHAYVLFGIPGESDLEGVSTMLSTCVELVRIHLDQNDLSLVGDPSRSSHGGDSQLSDRQILILRYMAEGMTNTQIARRIRFSDSLVRHEGQAIFRKLGVKDRRMAVKRAIDLGLLDETAA